MASGFFVQRFDLCFLCASILSLDGNRQGQDNGRSRCVISRGVSETRRWMERPI